MDKEKASAKREEGKTNSKRQRTMNAKRRTGLEGIDRKAPTEGAGSVPQHVHRKPLSEAERCGRCGSPSIELTTTVLYFGKKGTFLVKITCFTYSREVVARVLLLPRVHPCF